MNFKQIEFHNVGELGKRDGVPGLFLYRYPAAVRKAMTPLGNVAATNSSGVELRFCTDSYWGSVTLSLHSEYAWQTTGSVDVYKGDIFCGRHTIEEGRLYTIKLTPPALLRELNDKAFAGAHFAPTVWRLVLGDGIFIFHEVTTAGRPIRPPKKDEKPRLRWLAYGSSITNVAADGYVHHAARLLGVDLLNKGMCGSCCCEKETAAYLAGKETWDFATLELGVNMRGQPYRTDFEKRAKEFVSILRRRHPDKPIVLIGIFPNSDDYQIRPNDMGACNREYRQALRNIVAKANSPNLQLIEGDRVLTHFGGLGQDLIHPSPAGHVLMGRNLAALLEPVIKKLKR
ncbi:MAG: hypothetical protein HY343_13150 [Lentisphaerae bacterium]|nr:hypothetical protein [Lentisphaerota bacterium]